MSATGRGSERNEDDFYATPAWCVRRLLEAVRLPPGFWLEPGAGTGAIIEAVGPGDIIWTAVDKKLRPDRVMRSDTAWWEEDFLGDEVVCLAADMGGFNVALGNPPYKLAQQFADRCFMLSKWTALLLRLNFLGSEERAGWWEKHPADVYVLPNRPSFCVKAKCPNCGTQATYPADTKTLPALCIKCGAKNRVTRTDATEYAWFVWPGAGQLYHLALTPESERYNRAPMPTQEKHQ